MKIELITIPPLNHHLLISKVKNAKEFCEVLLRHKKEFNWLKRKLGKFELDGDENAVVLSKNNIPRACIFFKTLNKENVIHETNHIVFDLAKFYGFENEPEFNAYLQTWLYNEIIKILK